MAIKDKPITAPTTSPSITNVERFVSGAPDAQVPATERKKEPKKGGKQLGKHPITLTIDARLLDKIDQAARIAGMSRSAYITMGMNYVVTKGIFKD